MKKRNDKINAVSENLTEVVGENFGPSLNFEELKELLEGARVLEIKESSRRESICEFFVEKNERKYSFTLFCTDLGYWIEDRKDDKSNFMNFQELLEAIFEHHSSHNDFENDIFEPFDKVTQKIIGFRCRKCEKEFKVKIESIKNSEYYELLNDVEKRKLFARILSEGWIDKKDRAIEMIARMRED